MGCQVAQGGGRVLRNTQKDNRGEMGEWCQEISPW